MLKKGMYTYAQAKYLAIAGVIDGLRYQQAKQVVYLEIKGGISSAIRYAQLRWQNVSADAALLEANHVGLQTHGMSFALQILGAQLFKAQRMQQISALVKAQALGTSQVLRKIDPQITADELLATPTLMYATQHTLAPISPVEITKTLIIWQATMPLDELRERFEQVAAANNILISGPKFFALGTEVTTTFATYAQEFFMIEADLLAICATCTDEESLAMLEAENTGQIVQQILMRKFTCQLKKRATIKLDAKVLANALMTLLA